MVGMLLAFGVEADAAIASVLAYRSVAIWLPAPVGLLALGSLRRTVARWSAQDASEPTPSPPPASASPKPRAVPRASGVAVCSSLSGS
jgi:hypothetical protein